MIHHHTHPHTHTHTQRGAAALVEMLGVNQTLKTICLKFNYIPDPWAIKWDHCTTHGIMLHYV